MVEVLEKKASAMQKWMLDQNRSVVPSTETTSTGSC